MGDTTRVSGGSVSAAFDGAAAAAAAAAAAQATATAGTEADAFAAAGAGVTGASEASGLPATTEREYEFSFKRQEAPMGVRFKRWVRLHPKTTIMLATTIATIVALVITGLIGTYGGHGLSFQDMTQLDWKVWVIGAGTFVGLNLLFMGIYKGVKMRKEYLENKRYLEAQQYFAAERAATASQQGGGGAGSPPPLAATYVNPHDGIATFHPHQHHQRTPSQDQSQQASGGGGGSASGAPEPQVTVTFDPNQTVASSAAVAAHQPPMHPQPAGMVFIDRSSEQQQAVASASQQTITVEDIPPGPQQPQSGSHGPMAAAAPVPKSSHDGGRYWGPGSMGGY